MSNKRSTLWFKQETQVKELDSVSNSPPGRFSRTFDHQPLWYFITRSVCKVKNALTSPVDSVSNLPSVWTRRPPPRWLYYYIYTWSPANYSFKDTCGVSATCVPIRHGLYWEQCTNIIPPADILQRSLSLLKANPRVSHPRTHTHLSIKESISFKPPIRKSSDWPRSQAWHHRRNEQSQAWEEVGMGTGQCGGGILLHHHTSPYNTESTWTAQRTCGYSTDLKQHYYHSYGSLEDNKKRAKIKTVTSPVLTFIYNQHALNG